MFVSKAAITLLLVIALAASWQVEKVAFADLNVTVTRQFSPSANAAVAGQGDENGFQTTPINAYAPGGGFAIDVRSGSANNSIATGTGTDKHNFFSYGLLDGISSGFTVSGITVRADIAVDSLTDNPFTAIRLSWDGGTSFTATQQFTLSSTTSATYTYGGSGDTWGRPWSPSELSNASFRVQVINGDTANNRSNRDFSLDWIPVSITFTAPWDSYSDLDRTIESDNFTILGSYVYMKGTGFNAGTYNVVFYDATVVGGGNKKATDAVTVAGDGILNSQIQPAATVGVGGTWHALVQPATGYIAFPDTYDAAVASPDAYGLLANDAFTVAPSAIPEFPSVISAIVVIGLCATIYWWMKKKSIKVAQG